MSSKISKIKKIFAENFEIAFARKICYNENKNEGGGNVAKILANAL